MRWHCGNLLRGFLIWKSEGLCELHGSVIEELTSKLQTPATYSMFFSRITVSHKKGTPEVAFSTCGKLETTVMPSEIRSEDLSSSC